MERYLGVQIRESNSYEVLFENLQIIARGTTIGEIDFILLDKIQRELVHLELAYKFYLYDPDLPAELPRWIGPNRNDRLVDKLKKLGDHQFPLLFRQETKQVLAQLEIPDLPWRQELCFKAQLYLPHKWRKECPSQIYPEAVSGYWIHFDDFQSIEEGLYHIPEKENWTVDPSCWTEWCSKQEVIQQLENRAKNRRSTMCWINNANQRFDKCFVVWW